MAWALTGVLSPLEGSFRIGAAVTANFHAYRDLKCRWSSGRLPDARGLILVRQSETRRIASGNVVAVHDPLGETRLALALDYVGRDEGILLRAGRLQRSARQKKYPTSCPHSHRTL